MNYSYRLFSVTMWMSYLKRGWAGRDIPRKGTWGKVEYEVKESQSSTLSQGAELLPQSSHGETEERGHLRAHTHTHICLMGECCVCEVGLAWGVGGRKKKVWGGWGVGRNFWKKVLLPAEITPIFHLFLHPWYACGMSTGSCSVSSSLSKNNMSAWESPCTIVRLWTHVTLDLLHPLLALTLFFLLVQSDSFFYFTDDGKSGGWNI